MTTATNQPQKPEKCRYCESENHTTEECLGLDRALLGLDVAPSSGLPKSFQPVKHPDE